jgi:hypothetical protein
MVLSGTSEQGDAMTETTEAQQAVEQAGSLELIRVPAWEAKYSLSDNPEELAHLICCRDLEWRRALCGYVEEDPKLLHDSENICTMCVETVERLGVSLGDRQCPVDQRECPPDDEVHRMIDERVSP